MHFLNPFTLQSTDGSVDDVQIESGYAGTSSDRHDNDSASHRALLPGERDHTRNRASPPTEGEDRISCVAGDQGSKEFVSTTRFQGLDDLLHVLRAVRPHNQQRIGRIDDDDVLEAHHRDEPSRPRVHETP